MSSKKSDTTAFPQHNPFLVGFGHDRTIFLQIMIAIILLAISGIAGFAAQIGDRRMSIYKSMIPVGMFFVVIVQIVYYIAIRRIQPEPRVYRKKAIGILIDIFVYKQVVGWIVIVVNLLIMGIATTMMLIRGYEVYQVVDEFFTATWEQLIFAVLCMSFAVQFFRTGWLSKRFSRRAVSFICSLALVDIAFAICHWWAYGGNFRAIAIIAASGLVFMAIGYRWPSVGLSLHFGYNILITLTN
ncbi:MAG: hypothetical protein E3J70_01650 [Candidatus Heimdallarchaeota archaeon]|nr:MAG: hypothetical protein E3J70_01650 [Candidatus Heimdallarchaeota archaeon]